MRDVGVAGELRERRDVDAGPAPVRERGVPRAVNLEVDRRREALLDAREDLREAVVAEWVAVLVEEQRASGTARSPVLHVDVQQPADAGADRDTPDPGFCLRVPDPEDRALQVDVVRPAKATELVLAESTGEGERDDRHVAIAVLRSPSGCEDRGYFFVEERLAAALRL